jgi:hypothetical protein
MTSNGRWGWREALRRLLRAGHEETELVLELARDATWSTCVDGPGIEVRCCAGLALVTVEGDPGDHVLAAGATLAPDRRGRVAVWALEPTRVCVTERTSRADDAVEGAEGQARRAGARGAALGMGSSGARQ